MIMNSDRYKTELVLKRYEWTKTRLNHGGNPTTDRTRPPVTRVGGGVRASLTLSLPATTVKILTDAMKPCGVGGPTTRGNIIIILYVYINELVRICCVTYKYYILLYWAGTTTTTTTTTYSRFTCWPALHTGVWQRNTTTTDPDHRFRCVSTPLFSFLTGRGGHGRAAKFIIIEFSSLFIRTCVLLYIIYMYIYIYKYLGG